MVLTGSLNFLNFGELLQLLGSNSSSGMLRIISKYAPMPGVVYIEKGNPINASNGSSTGLEAIYALFGWTEGQFEFIRDEVSCEKLINRSRMEIILDGLRMLDEGKIEKLGPVSFNLETAESNAKSDKLPLIKGPLVDYTCIVDEEGFYDGDEIVHEGNHGNWIWVILEGVAEIIKETPDGPVKIVRIGDGGFLGSVASLLTNDNVRSATVVAAGNIQLGMLDSQFLSSELANLSKDLKELIKSLDERLRQVTHTAAEIRCQNGNRLDFIKDKRPVIKEGQKEERLFRIREGDAIVARHSDYGFIPLAHLHEGDFLGHVSFLDMGHEPYSASIFASSDLKLTVVDTEKLKAEHNTLSSTLKNILEHLATSISVTSMIACDFQKEIASAASGES
ncbi:MAG: cyclic nucleotide-binding domain-containing protein [Desulfobacterales bacterium]|nr:MAG: cyclic nucleotide-binding domain-containing protein [Desulfobacterales bacterium]